MMRASDTHGDANESVVIVGIDAATPAGGVALASGDGRLLAHAWQDNRRPVSQRILADLDRSMQELEIDPTRMRAVAVTLGPGAFTGLRVGLTIAKTLAQGWGVALYGYSTLETAARRWPVAGDVVCVLLDARRGDLYSGLYRIVGDGRPEPLREDRVEPIETLIEEIAASGFEAIRFSGGGATMYREAIAAGLSARALWIEPPWNAPAADMVALAGAEDWRLGREGSDPLSVEPIYLRVSDAERRQRLTMPEVEKP